MAKLVRVEIKMLSLNCGRGFWTRAPPWRRMHGPEAGPPDIHTRVYGFVSDAIVVKSHITKRIQTVLISLVSSLIIGTIGV